jgi:hypothetical protein
VAEQVRDHQAFSYIRFYQILNFTVFEWTFLFTVIYLNSICKCTLMGRNSVVRELGLNRSFGSAQIREYTEAARLSSSYVQK